MKKHLSRILAAVLALCFCFALSGCDILVPITGEYRILSINDIGPKRFFAEDSAEGAAFIEMLGFSDDEFEYTGPENEIITITLEKDGTGYVTKLGYLTYAVWSEADDIVTVNCESGEVLVLEHFPGSSAMSCQIEGYTVLFSRL